MSVGLPYSGTLPTGKHSSQYLEDIYQEVISDQNRYMDKHDRRQQKLRHLRDKHCNGSNAELARRLSRDPSYISRLFYPATKKGYKRIGDDMIDVIEVAFAIKRGTFDLDGDEAAANTAQEPKDAQQAYLMSAIGQRAIGEAGLALAEDAHDIAKLWLTLPSHERERFAAAIRRRAAALHQVPPQESGSQGEAEPNYGRSYTPTRRTGPRKDHAQ